MTLVVGSPPTHGFIRGRHHKKQPMALAVGETHPMALAVGETHPMALAVGETHPMTLVVGKR